MSYSVLPLETAGRNNGGEHTLAMISINGQPMRAFFDTGANTSFITEHAAAKAGVKTTDPGVTQIGQSQGVDGQLKTWVASFASIKIGDEEIKNGKLAIGESVANDFDVLIGADFFMAHHVYVANSQGKLYFTYSGGPVFRTSAPSQTAASAH
jgi:predicted aspartyl protease